MDDETRAAFARMDRYFELSQAQFLALDDKVSSLGDKVSSLDDRLTSLTAEFRQFRDWVVAELGDIRRELRALRRWVEERLGSPS